MKKYLLLLLVASALNLPEVWAQAPPPPPPTPPIGVGAPIDSDILFFLLPVALFAVYRLNKKQITLI